MYRTLTMATTALTLVVPAYAGNMMGKVSLGGGYAWEDFSIGSTSWSNDFPALYGSGSVNVPYNDRVNLQLDVFAAASADNDSNGGGDSFFGGSGLGVHLNYRDQSGALGVFAALARANEGSSSYVDEVVFAAGIEGQYYCNMWTLKAQAGYLDSDDGDNGDLFEEAGFIDVGAIYYASSKLKLSGSLGYMDGATSGGDDPDDIDQWHWSLGAEYLFGKSIPVASYVEYRGQATTEYSSGGSDRETDSHMLNVGVRFYFGSESDLMKADREGAGMSSPDLLAWPRYDLDGKS